jgi:hypothetical protein
MRRLAWLTSWAERLAPGAILVTVATATGCGGPEFVAAAGPDDGGAADAAAADATLLPDGKAPANDGEAPEAASDAGHAGDAGKPEKDGGDAATSPTDASSTDSGDATTSPTDGGDAGPPAFACPSPDPTAIFCSVFDKETLPPWDWASDPITPKASEAADTVDFLSPPNGFNASNKLLLGTDTAQVASLGKPFTSLALHIDYSFHMFIKQYDTLNNPAIPVAQLTVGPSTPAAFSLDLVVKGGELSLEQEFTGTDGGSQTTSTNVGAVATGAWVKVELLLDRSATNWSAAVSLNDGLKLTAQTAATPSNQNLEVDLGILLILPTSTPNSITFDNVLVRGY